MLTEKTKEKLRQYESSLRKKRRQNRISSQEARSCVDTRTMLERRNYRRGSSVRSPPVPALSGAIVTESSPQITPTDRHFAQVVNDGHITSEPDNDNGPPPLNSPPEESATVEQDCRLDERDSQTGEFVSSNGMPPLAPASSSSVPTSTAASCFAPLYSTRGHGLPMLNLTPPLLTLPPQAPGTMPHTSPCYVALQW